MKFFNDAPTVCTNLAHPRQAASVSARNGYRGIAGPGVNGPTGCPERDGIGGSFGWAGPPLHGAGVVLVPGFAPGAVPGAEYPDSGHDMPKHGVFLFGSTVFGHDVPKHASGKVRADGGACGTPGTPSRAKAGAAASAIHAARIRAFMAAP